MGYSSCIAIVGKGGVGKTTVAAFTIRYLLERGIKPLLAVDADPSSCLGGVLGVEVAETIGGLREDTRSAAHGIPEGIPKQQYLAMKVQEAIIEAQGFDLLAMGRPEGPGCYCFVNNVLREHLDRLSRNYQATVIDCEAGLEHLSRRTAQDVQTMILVADPTVKALNTINTILTIARDLRSRIERKLLLLNRVPAQDQERVLEMVHQYIDPDDFAAIGSLPQDGAIFAAELAGRNLLSLENSSAYQVYCQFLDALAQPLVL